MIPEPQTVSPEPGLECWIDIDSGVHSIVIGSQFSDEPSWWCPIREPSFHYKILAGPFYKTERDARIAEYLQAKRKADEALRYAETLLERLNAE